LIIVVRAHQIPAPASSHRTGTVPALSQPCQRATEHFIRRLFIRTLSVSLLAVAAIAASLLIVRQRDERGSHSPLIPGGDGLPAQQLDAIRAAGW
jgi:hypothetical protein